MSAVVGFLQEDVELVKKFAEAFGIWLKPDNLVEIEVNDNEDDTLLFGEFAIIQDDCGNFQAYSVKTTYSWEHGPECDEVEIGSSKNLFGALCHCAKHDLGAKLEAFQDNFLIPQEFEPQG